MAASAPKAAAHMDVESFDRFDIVIVGRAGGRTRRYLGGDEADIADIMLGAGMVAAGEVDVDRRVEGNARLAPRCDRFRGLLGVGGGEAAAGRARAGDEAGADRARPCAEAERRDGDLRLDHARIGNAGDQEVLPHCEPDIAVAETARHLGEAAQLRDLHPSRRQHDADPVQPRLLLG